MRFFKTWLALWLFVVCIDMMGSKCQQLRRESLSSFYTFSHRATESMSWYGQFCVSLSGGLMHTRDLKDSIRFAPNFAQSHIFVNLASSSKMDNKGSLFSFLEKVIENG